MALTAGCLSCGGGSSSAAAPSSTPSSPSGAFTLDAYALRAPADTAATLHLALVPGNSQAVFPSSRKEVQVKVTNEQGSTLSSQNYPSVPCSNGQATISFGNVPQLANVAVQATVETVPAQQLSADTAVAEFAVNSRQVVVPDFEGYGAQMNQNLYTSLSDPSKGWLNSPPLDTGDVEAKVKAMDPGLSRIFLSADSYADSASYNPDLMPSFYKTVELAQAAGARINITWWFLRHVSAADQQATTDQDMQNFAGTLADLIQNHGITNLDEITIQNEPDPGTWLVDNMGIYEYAYRQLDTYLKQAGIRSRIKFVGGDLVANGQQPFLEYMAQHMDDVLDGWTEHIYWNYFDTGYMLSRLSEILALVAQLKSSGLPTKPLSITEYGVRGYRTLNGQPIQDPDPYRNGELTNTLAGYYLNPDGSLTPVNETNTAAFQEAWFNMQAVNDGFIGLSKWDFYRAQYDFSYQDHSLIGYLFNPATGQDRWPLRPAYYMEWLMAHTTGQHWQVLGYHGAAGAELITPFRSPSGAWTIFAINTNAQAASLSVGGLPANTIFSVLAWNAAGAGKLAAPDTADSGPGGAVQVNIPAQGLVALTTVSVPSFP